MESGRNSPLSASDRAGQTWFGLKDHPWWTERGCVMPTGKASCQGRIALRAKELAEGGQPGPCISLQQDVGQH